MRSTTSTIDTHARRAKRHVWIVAAMLAIGLSLGPSSIASAQEATPGAVTCVAPELPPGTPTPMEPPASPESMDGMEMGSPEAEPPAPEPTAAPAGTPAEGATAEEIIATATNIASCINAGDYEGAVALFTTNLMMDEFGTANPYDLVGFLEGFTFGEFELTNPTVLEDGRVTVDLSYMETPYQPAAETWFLEQEGDLWKLGAFAEFTPETDLDTAVVGVALTGPDDAGMYAIVPNVESHSESPALIFHAQNTGTEDHELAIARLPEGADPLGALDGTIPEEQIEFIGAVDMGPDEEADLVLIGLPPGVYTMVCFFEGPDGAPHAANGMVAQFEVTAAE